MCRLTLSTVPADIHLEIIRHLTGNSSQCDQTKDGLALVKDLSLVCRSVNDSCGTIIFRKCHLDFSKLLSVADDGSAVKRCDAEAVGLRRFANLERKASFVRELCVTLPNDPAEILPSLCAIFPKLHGLISVHLISDSDSTLLDIDLWNRLVDASPQTLRLTGGFHIPDGLTLQPVLGLTSLKVGRYQKESKAIVNALSPSCIHLHYVNDCEPILYKPADSNLKHVSVEVDALNCRFENAFLDFSHIRQAHISVKVTFYVPSSLIELFAWQITRERIHRMFAEDLDSYDVRHYEERVYITRSPEEGWQPVYQDHHVNLKGGT